MNHSIRQKFIGIVNQHGASLTQDLRHCEAYLKDLMSQHKLAVNVLVCAFRNGVPSDLKNSNRPIEYLLPQLVIRLEEEHGIKREIARWVVDSWALALNVVSESNLPDYESKLVTFDHTVVKQEIELILISGGTFEMGNRDGKPDEKPLHTVEFDEFYIGKYEITNAQYAKFLNEYKMRKMRKFSEEKMICEHDWGIKKQNGVWRPAKGYENHPVVMVTWYGASEFCRHYGFRLPTEAEWEYAARSGGKNETWAGTSDESSLSKYAWYRDDFNDTPAETQPVGGKEPNELGLYDMTGNVWEWCQDWYDGAYYQYCLDHCLVRNNQNDNKTPFKVLRGGSWNNYSQDCLSTIRSGNHPENSNNEYGFRVASSEIS